jgi:malyl-CoA/(S)-citramalyl-CoA lyase
LPQAKPSRINPKKGKAMDRTPFMVAPRLRRGKSLVSPCPAAGQSMRGAFPVASRAAGAYSDARSRETTLHKPPRDFFKPLAIGAPQPWRELPVRLERMIHFVPPHVEKMRAKIPDLVREVDVVLGNLEDAIPADRKLAARQGFVRMARDNDFGRTGLWVRINALNSPWALDDVVDIVSAVGDRLDVIMLPKVEGPWDIHYLDQLLAQLEARHGIERPILIHAILETAQGVKNVAEIAAASPRMHGMSLGPADLAASRAMKTTRVGGGHPDYAVLADPTPDTSVRARVQQDPWHYTLARMVDACASYGLKPFYGPFGDFSDPEACEAQFRNAFLLGCAGAWTLHPSQIAIAKRVFSPDPAEVSFARRILEAMPDGTGAVMIDGKMQDDATWKQAKVIVDLARMVAEKEPEAAGR